ncbi:hypothetical protein BJX76DRAFT_364322 [Aspergillus varians]
MKKLGPFMFLLYISFIPDLGCTHTGSAVDVAPAQINDHSEDVDLISFLNSRTQKHDDLFTEALKLLESVSSSPSCNKLAATKLVTSCKSIKRNPESPGSSDTYLALENVRSLYAARLAVCEISGAGISIPSPCQPMNVSPSPKKGLFGFYTKQNSASSDTDPVSKEDLEPCLRSLESRPQWWTSYSNSKQNAMIICHASRSEIDQENILETYNTILQSSAKLSDGLQEALKMAAEGYAKGRTFMQSTELLRNEALQAIEESTSSLLVRLSQNLEARFGSFIENIFSVLNSVHAGFSELQTNIQNSSSEVNALRHMLQCIHDELLLRSEQIALTQRQNAATQDELALSLRSKLQSITQRDITKLSQDVEILDSSLEWLYGRMAQIIEQEESFSERLGSIGSSLEEFQLRVDNLGKIQQRQYEIATAQAQAQEELQTDMRISKGILDQTASIAANLQATIEEAMKSRETSVLSGILGPYSTWVVPGALWILVTRQGLIYRSAAMAVLICVYMRHLLTQFNYRDYWPTWFVL